MTAITITAPASTRRLALQPRSTVARPARRAAVRPEAGPSAKVAAAPLRLTRRGRLAITGMLAGVGIAISLFAGGVSLAGTDSAPVATRYVTVAPGETLWAIAGEVAPGADRRDTIQRILELNAMPSASVLAGQRIAVPAS